MPNDSPPSHSTLSARVTALEELLTYQEQTIEALNEAVLELRESMEKLKSKVARLHEKGRGSADDSPGGEQNLPPRPGLDPEAPPHY